MSTELVVIIVALVVAAALFVWQHKRTSANVAVTRELSSVVKSIPSVVAGHVELATSAMKAKVDAATTVIRADVAKAIGGSPAKPLPVVGTTAEPAPAAPAASVTAATPPATVAPAASPAAPAPSAGGSGTTELDIWPQVTEVDGVHMQVSAPLNPAFKLDPMTKAYDSPTSYLFEPSNGGKCVPPQPLRSPAGYPLFYALGAGNAPVGPARVLYGGNTFPDDAAVATYIATVAQAHAADDVAAAAAAAQVFAGPVPVAALTHADLQFLWWATINPATPKMHNWEYTVLSGSRAAIQQAMATIGNNVAQMHGYDAAKYNGVLRSHYDAAVGAPEKAAA